MKKKMSRYKGLQKAELFRISCLHLVAFGRKLKVKNFLRVGKKLSKVGCKNFRKFNQEISCQKVCEIDFIA